MRERSSEGGAHSTDRSAFGGWGWGGNGGRNDEGRGSDALRPTPASGGHSTIRHTQSMRIKSAASQAWPVLP